jgi:hypothetical protein
MQAELEKNTLLADKTIAELCNHSKYDWLFAVFELYRESCYWSPEYAIDGLNEEGRKRFIEMEKSRGIPRNPSDMAPSRFWNNLVSPYWASQIPEDESDNKSMESYEAWGRYIEFLSPVLEGAYVAKNRFKRPQLASRENLEKPSWIRVHNPQPNQEDHKNLGMFWVDEITAKVGRAFDIKSEKTLRELMVLPDNDDLEILFNCNSEPFYKLDCYYYANLFAYWLQFEPDFFTHCPESMATAESITSHYKYADQQFKMLLQGGQHKILLGVYEMAHNGIPDLPTLEGEKDFIIQEQDRVLNREGALADIQLFKNDKTDFLFPLIEEWVQQIRRELEVMASRETRRTLTEIILNQTLPFESIYLKCLWINVCQHQLLLGSPVKGALDTDIDERAKRKFNQPLEQANIPGTDLVITCGPPTTPEDSVSLLDASLQGSKNIHKGLVLAKMPLHQLRLRPREDWLFAAWELFAVHYYYGLKFDEGSFCPFINVNQEERAKRIREEQEQGFVLNKPRGWNTVTSIKKDPKWASTYDKWVNDKLERIERALSLNSDSDDISLYSICTPVVEGKTWELSPGPKSRYLLYAALFARLLTDPLGWLPNNSDQTTQSHSHQSPLVEECVKDNQEVLNVGRNNQDKGLTSQDLRQLRGCFSSGSKERQVLEKYITSFEECVRYADLQDEIWGGPNQNNSKRPYQNAEKATSSVHQKIQSIGFILECHTANSSTVGRKLMRKPL